MFDLKKPTTQMLGRWQPWHEGHRACFEQILGLGKPGYKNKKHDAQQVCIMVRCLPLTAESPYSYEQVAEMIAADLSPEYDGQYVIVPVPDITDVFYGRTVGFDVHRVNISPELESIESKTVRAERAAAEARFFKNRG